MNLQKLLCIVLVIGVICVWVHAGELTVPETFASAQYRVSDPAGKLLLRIHNKHPHRATFSLYVNGRKIVCNYNPTARGQTFIIRLRHFTPLKRVEIYKHTSQYGALYIDRLQAYDKSLLPQLIFSGRDRNTTEDANLFDNDPVCWSELCASIHHGKYIYQPEFNICPFVSH